MKISFILLGYCIQLSCVQKHRPTEIAEVFYLTMPSTAKTAWSWRHPNEYVYGPRLELQRHGKMEDLGEIQCHFVHHKSYTEWPDIKPTSPRQHDGN